MLAQFQFHGPGPTPKVSDSRLQVDYGVLWRAALKMIMVRILREEKSLIFIYIGHVDCIECRLSLAACHRVPN